MELYSQNLSLPIGDVYICSDGSAVTEVGFGFRDAPRGCPVTERCARELAAPGYAGTLMCPFPRWGRRFK